MSLFRATIVSLPLLAGLALLTAQAQQPQIGRTELQSHDLSLAGHKAVQVRVDFARGAAFGRHRHPGEEIVYVIKGLIAYEIDGQPPVTLKAGQVVFIPAGVTHAARNVGSGDSAELATYIVEKGPPLVELVK